MKKLAEKRTEDGVRLLLQSMTRNWEDIGVILEEFEETHDDYEKFKSKAYQALGVGYFALQTGIEKMNSILNG
ncbi:MAG: hypothetical protein HDR98_01120 [Bacteroides sp.]|nr:hypothetical protein [Bacteroides sp.]